MEPVKSMELPVGREEEPVKLMMLPVSRETEPAKIAGASGGSRDGAGAKMVVHPFERPGTGAFAPFRPPSMPGLAS